MGLVGMRKAKAISLLIFASGFLVAALLVFMFSASKSGPSGSASTQVTWTEEVGAGIVAPACGSSGTSVTCVGVNPRVTFTWSTPYDTGGRKCRILVNGAEIVKNRNCSGDTYTWNGASPYTTYSYEIRVQ